MKILLIQIEKTTDTYLQDGVKVYTERLKNYISLNIETISMPKLVRQKPFEEQRKAEAPAVAEVGHGEWFPFHGVGFFENRAVLFTDGF